MTADYSRVARGRKKLPLYEGKMIHQFTHTMRGHFDIG